MHPTYASHLFMPDIWLVAPIHVTKFVVPMHAGHLCMPKISTHDKKQVENRIKGVTLGFDLEVKACQVFQGVFRYEELENGLRFRLRPPLPDVVGLPAYSDI